MTNFKPTRPIARSVFAAAAVVATLLTGAFIDGLARTYSSEGLQFAHTQPIVVAAVSR